MALENAKVRLLLHIKVELIIGSLRKNDVVIDVHFVTHSSANPSQTINALAFNIDQPSLLTITCNSTGNTHGYNRCPR